MLRQSQAKASTGSPRDPWTSNRSETSEVKLHATGPTAIHSFTGYGDDYVAVNGRRIVQSVVVLPERLIEGWEPGTLDALSAAHLEALLGLDREVVLLGTGPRMRFPPPAVMRPALAKFSAAGVGLEVMDVHAACRTYNILVAEERKVAAALLLGPA